jgi:hypothetical protein
MAINPNTNFTTGQVLTATNANQWPRGVMAYSTKTSTIGLTTTSGDLGLSVTFTAEANRYYKYTFWSYAANASTASTLGVFLCNSSNTELSALNMYVPGGAAYTYINFSTVRTESAGSVTRKMRGNTQFGTGSIYADAVNVAYLLVEDMGPA